MSADHWAICPRCLETAKDAHDDALQHALSLYGVVPLSEFEEARAAADVPFNAETFRTFREDYEFYGAEDGTVTASYSGECQTCGLHLSFSDEHPFWSSVRAAT